MNTWTLFLILLALSISAFVIGWRRSHVLRQLTGQTLHSLPSYYGTYVALWTGLPALALVLIWLLCQDTVIGELLLRTLPPSRVQGLSPGQESLLLAEIRQVARGAIFIVPEPWVLEAAHRYARWQAIANWAMVAAAIGVALLGLAATRARISPAFRARQGVERITSFLMILCSVVAILTTLGIVLSLAVEASRFFAKVPVSEFLFGLRWEPQIPLRADQVAGLGAFGALPVFAGTLLISAIAMAIAGPLGLMAAIYLAEFASRPFRSVVKPLLEILAGVPTVVYGFFAILVVAPALRQFGMSIDLDVSPNSALAAGAVMGIMIIPFVSSLSDDALNAVPQALRDGSIAMGATKTETIKSVLIPAALPGITGGFLLAVSRAIGETMIVVMAAGLIARLTINPLESVTTVTVQIVSLLIGDIEFDNPKTLSAFALGLVLFLATLALNIIALRIVQKYREKYE